MTEEDRQKPRPYTGHLYRVHGQCFSCRYVLDAEFEEIPAELVCENCGGKVWIDRKSSERNINAWSLTPRGENLGYVDEPSAE